MKLQMIDRSARLAAAAGLFALATAIAGGAGAQPAARIPLTLAVSSNTLAYGGLRIAEQAGLFQTNGIEPKIVVMDSGNAAITAVLSGSAEFSSSGPGEVIAARVRGQKMVIVTNVYRGLSGSVVLAKSVADKLGAAASGGVEQKLKALDGLTIAVPSATSAYLHPVKSAAEAVKAKVKFVYMAQPAMVAALQTGAIQGMVAGAPFSLTPVANGTGVLWISGPKAELPASVLPTSSACLQTSEAYAGRNPDVVKRLQATFINLAAFIKEKPAEAKAMLAKAYPQLDPATVDAIFEEDADNWSQPLMTEADMRQEIDIQIASGSLQGADKVDPASLLLMPKSQ